MRGRFLWAGEDDEVAGAEGGSRAVALSVSELPAHSHTVVSHTHSTPNHVHTWTSENNLWSGSATLGAGSRILIGGVKKSGVAGLALGTSTSPFNGWEKGGFAMASSGGGTSGAASPATSSVGSGDAHDNMPPYVVANLWHRVA